VASSSPSQVSFVVAINEKLSIDWFGENCPPYWRRALNQSDVPVEVGGMRVATCQCVTRHTLPSSLVTQMLSEAISSCANVLKRCDSFDDEQEELLTQAGGAERVLVIAAWTVCSLESFAFLFI
jgi:hypothetical protein